MAKRVWTSQEVDIIRSGFMSGKLVKTIAEEVGRSPTAVNKFLSRSGIRKRRWSIGKCEKRKTGLSYVRNSEVKDQQKRDKCYSDSRTILTFLQENGYNISITNSQQRMFYPSDYYFLVNGKPTSLGKLLLLANRLRSEKQQPIFNLPYVVW